MTIATLTLLSVICASLAALPNKDVTVTIENKSTLKGFIDDDNVANFYGVPYAEAPVGKLRFADPQPAGHSKDVIDCTKYGDACIQLSNSVGSVPGNTSENCLFLNIFSPDVSGSAPVMFFIHGGAFVTGSGERYAGTEYAKRHGVVLVNINYRLNVFGFYYDKANNITGNQGLKDQVLALKWVNENIKHFGGNPEKITIFGESAGSASVSHLVLSPDTKQLFQRAIMESGVANAQWAFAPTAAAQMEAELIKKNLKCADNMPNLACLQGADTKTIMNALEKAKVGAFAPTLDGQIVVQDPKERIAEGKYNNISMIVGFNKNEAWLFIPMMWRKFKELSNNGTNPAFCTTDKIYNEGITALADASADPQERTPCLVDAYMQQYSQWEPPSTPEKRAQGLADFVTDAWFKIPSIQFTLMSPQPVHVYLFDYASNFTAAALGGIPAVWMGAVHASELSLVFGMPFDPPKGQGLPEPTDDDKAVSQNFMRIWANFAENGTASWPEFNAGNEQSYTVINEALTVNTYPRWNEYRFWTNYVPELMTLDCKNKTAMPTTTTPPTTTKGSYRFGATVLLTLAAALAKVI